MYPKILDFRGFDSSQSLISRGGISTPMGNLPESLSQRILVRRFSVWRLAVFYYSELRMDSRKNNVCLTWLQNMSAYSAGHYVTVVYAAQR